MRKSLLTITAASLIASSTVAQAAPVVDVRDAAPIGQVEGLSGDDEGTTIIPIILGIGALIAILLLTGDDEEDEAPFSP